MRPNPGGKGLPRVRSRRAVLARIEQVMLVLAVLCLVIAGLIAGLAQLLNYEARPAQFRLSIAYLVAAAGLFILRGITRLVRKRVERRRSRRPPAARGSVRPVRSPSRQSGAALIFVLVILGLLAVLLAQIRLRAESARRRAASALLHEQLRHAATSAAREMLQLLADDPDTEADHTNEPWASPHEFTSPTGVSTWTRVVDAQRAFDLNNVAVDSPDAPRSCRDILMDLMTLCGDFTPVGRVEALRDWVDEDEEGMRESDYYAEKDPPYVAPNRPLYLLSEALWTDGFRRDYFSRAETPYPRRAFEGHLLDAVTVLPVPRTRPIPVNLNSASREVLQAVLGLEHEETVIDILTRRHRGPITSLADPGSMLNPQLVASVAPYVTVKSNFFEVEARAFAEGAGINLRALVQRTADGDVRILRWIL